MNRAKARRQRHDGDRQEPAVDVPRQPTLLSGRLILLCVMILAVAGAIIGLSLSVPDKGSSGAVATTQPFFNPTPTNLTPGIQNPTPWQYDPVTDRHWDPTVGHKHWHTGLPPDNPGATATTSTFSSTPNPAFSPTTRPSSGVPDIADPQPWEYDPVTNKFWNPLPGHLHWHAGQPPPPDQRQAAGQPVTPGPPPAPKKP